MPLYKRIVNKHVDTDMFNDILHVTASAVSGKGEAGKTTTCVLAFGGPRIVSQHENKVTGFKPGFDAQENGIVMKITRVVKKCKGFPTKVTIRGPAAIGEAAERARKVFLDRCIFLYLDNAWPGSRRFEHLMSLANGASSFVLFSTRSTALALGYT